MSFFSSLPGIIIAGGAILVVVVIYILGMLKKAKNNEDDRLINILQGTVTALEAKVEGQSEKITKQSQDIELLTKQVEELRKMEQKYIEILQGRDQETKDFYKRAEVAIRLVTQSHDLLVAMTEGMKNTNSAMQKLIEIVGTVVVKK